jgi:hypothetical protein
MGTFRGDPSSNVSDRVALSPSAMVSRSSDAVNVAALSRTPPRHIAAKTMPDQNVFFKERSIFQKPFTKFRR